MKYEIKEILDLLKYCVNKNEYLEEPNMKNWKPLLDYITNLQEEYEQLEQENKQLKEEIDKAIEYIKEKQKLNYMFETITLSKDSQNELLAILGDKENEEL